MMDPLDQRLTDLGTAWRRSQPEPLDLERFVARLDRRPSRAFPPRLMFVFVGALLLLSAVAIAPGVGGLFQGLRNGPPVTATASPSLTPTVTPGPSSSPSPVPVSPTPSTQPSDAERATTLLDEYEADLVAGRWQAAFDLLAPTSPTRATGLPAFSAERAAYFDSVAGRYTIGEPTRDVPDWTTYAPLIAGADVSRAYLIEVDYPALSGNNAGFEQYVVGPDAGGTWRIWPVR
jgi:hypothetical protein